MKLIISLAAIGFALSIGAFVVFATKVFYPHHRIVATTLHLLGWLPFLYSFFLYRNWIQSQAQTIQGIVTPYLPYIVLCVIFLLFAYLLATLIPFERSSIRHLSSLELHPIMETDGALLMALDERTDSLTDHLASTSLVTESPELPDKPQRDELRAAWQEFMTIFFELDVVKNRYKTFAQIPYFTRADDHSYAFLLTYGAYVEQYTSILKLHELLSTNEAAKKLINELEVDGSTDMFTLLSQRLTHPDDVMKLNAGRAYLAFIEKTHGEKHAELISLIHDDLRVIDDSVLEFSSIAIDNPLSLLEKRAFDFWFPIQKRAAVQLSHIRAVDRPYFLSPTILQKQLPRLQPGDILLERRTWHATNAGIPGFWPHAALYTGNLAELDTFFAEVEALNGTSFSDHVKELFPEVYAQMNTQDEHGYDIRVIEAKRPGVIFFSFEESANADGLAVLRPRLSKDELFESLQEAFRHAGKPYDFNFDFTTDTALVCSELIYKAYEGKISFEPTAQNGRLLLSPNDIAKKFAGEYNSNLQELDFILFFDPNEKKKRADEKDVQEFLTSWNRPKWETIADGIVR